MMFGRMAESTSLRPCDPDDSKWPPDGHQEQQNRRGFWPAPGSSRNVSLTEALDLTAPAGRAMTGLLSVFAEFEHEILRERIRAEIAQRLQIGRTSVRRILTNVNQ